MCAQVVGTRVSTLNRTPTTRPLVPLYDEALATRQARQRRGPRSFARRSIAGWGNINVVKVDRDVIAVVATDITDDVQSATSLWSRNGHGSPA